MPLFIYDVQNRSKQQSSDKSLINDQVLSELQRVFGQSGEFASLYARVFVVSRKAYYYLNKYTTNADALNIANWLPVMLSDLTIQMYEQRSYDKGSIVMTNTSGVISRYVATSNIASNELPGNSVKWLQLNASQASTSQHNIQQIEKITVNSGSREFNIVANTAVSINNTKIPMIQVMFENTDGKFEIAYPQITITKSSTITFNIKFFGDLSSIKNTQNNVIITLM